MSNNSLEDKNVKMLLVVVVVGLVIYLLVSYLNGNGICGSPAQEGFHTPAQLNEYHDTILEEHDHGEGDDEETTESEDVEASSSDYLGEDELTGAPVNSSSPENTTSVTEGFQNSEPQASDSTTSTEAEVVQSNEANVNNAPAECYPKDVLSSGDLLPSDANSKWAQVNPNGQGALGDKNFLTAGYHVGGKTVGQTLRNANRQLRSDPPNPQVKVSPWMQTTIEPDVNRKPMEIGA